VTILMEMNEVLDAEWGDRNLMEFCGLRHSPM
jgi:hypothetical protein